MPTKILKYKYDINLKDMYIKDSDNISKNNSFPICESIPTIKDETLSYSSTDSLMNQNKINESEFCKTKRKRDCLIEKYGRDKVRFHGNSTILLDSEKYKLLRKQNNEASKRSKKRREARDKLENFFIIAMLRHHMKNKKKLAQEIINLKKENEKLLLTNYFLKIMLKIS
jgi:hypothetical protein